MSWICGWCNQEQPDDKGHCTSCSPYAVNPDANGLHNITQEAEDMADQFFAHPPEPLNGPDLFEGTGHD